MCRRMSFSTGAKAVCVARNWKAHIQELGNAEPEEAVFFLKPSTALCSLSEPVQLPTWSRSVHHEVELALLIQTELKQATLAQASAAISHGAISLDLTARDIQSHLKAKGLPWEKAKAFDRSLPIGPWIPIADLGPLEEIEIQLSVNGHCRQSGIAKQMICGPLELLVEASRFFTLLPGDILLTGTPSGVGPLLCGDQLELTINRTWAVSTEVIHE